MTLLKFYRNNCSPCSMVDNYLKEKGVSYKSVNVEEDPELATQYGLTSVPVTILLDDKGNEVKRSIGFKPNELQELISQL